MLKNKASFFFLPLVFHLSLVAQDPCSFCNSSVIAKQKIYEDNQVIVLYDYKPIIEGHCLILPKRHVEQLHDLTDQEVCSIKRGISTLFKAAQKTYQATSYLIFQKNGEHAGQSVPHVHVHFLPRRPNDYWDISLYARMFFLRFKSPLLQKEVDDQRLKLSMQACWNEAL